MATDYYELLEIDRDASTVEIKRAYWIQARRHHPDANGGDRSTETQLAGVVRAHQILKKAGFC